MLTVAAVVEFLEQFAPVALAADWDNVGLLLGDRAMPVQRLMTCLTITPDSAAEAVEAGVQLIVTHHPILFRAAKRLTADTPEGRTVLALARAGVAVYCPHTAFDNTRDGINDLLARRLDLADTRPLRPKDARGQYKVVVFVPDSDLNRVADAMFAAGAGNIGQYSQCSFRLAGTGTFFGSEASNPTVGRKGTREDVSEWRLEAVCPPDKVDDVVAAIRRSHSYEEPAYDIYALRPTGALAGEGRIGRLRQPLRLEELGPLVKQALSLKSLPLVGGLARTVQQLAIVCGAGGDFLRDAVRMRADALLTGEVRFHDCLAAEAEGLALLLPGHYATERIGVEDLAVRLRERWPILEVWASRREHDPLSTM
jgi:dinuclear metal center YbgI/SA1388 family protein